jgi:hypothetical protein
MEMRLLLTIFLYILPACQTMEKVSVGMWEWTYRELVNGFSE